MLRPIHFVPLFLALAVTACGGSGSSSSDDSGGGDSSAPSASLLLGDAPTDNLSSFTVSVTELRLRDAAGGLTANLLTAPRSFDVLGLGLDAREALVDQVQLPAGRYRSARLVLDPASVEGRDRSGDLVQVSVVTSAAEAHFATTRSGDLVVGTRGFASVSFDLVLDQSLSEDAPGQFTFLPQLRASHGTATPPIDDFLGVVRSVHRPTRQFVVEVQDARVDASRGTVTVEVEDSDLLLNHSGAEFGNANAFLAALQTDDLVEIAGAFAQDGVFDASRCELEDRGGNQIRIEGRVQSVDLVGENFDLLFGEIEKGYGVAQPVLDALGNPGVLTIAWDSQTTFLRDKGMGVGSPADLLPGKKVDVRFRPNDFRAPMPFRAHSVRVDGGERYEGFIADTSGLPNSFTMILDNDHPARSTGLITGPVSVNLSASTYLFLDSGVSPLVNPADLLVGQKIKVGGPLSGSGLSGQVSATRIEVEAGRLRGTIESVSSTAAEFTVFVQKNKDPFGAPEPSGSTLVQLTTDAILDVNGTIGSIDQLRSAFANLSAGEFLNAEVEGRGDGGGGVIGVEVEVETESE